jgi:hypothetical protein
MVRRNEMLPDRYLQLLLLPSWSLAVGYFKYVSGLAASLSHRIGPLAGSTTCFISNAEFKTPHAMQVGSRRGVLFQLFLGAAGLLERIAWHDAEEMIRENPGRVLLCIHGGRLIGLIIGPCSPRHKRSYHSC